MRKIMRIKREVTRKYTRPGDTRDRQDRLWLCIHVEDEENQQYRLEPVFAYCLKDGKKTGATVPPQYFAWRFLA